MLIQLDLPDDYDVHTIFNVTNLIPFAGSTFKRDGMIEEGPITRSMARHIKAQEESKAPVHIKMLTTLSLCEHL